MIQVLGDVTILARLAHDLSYFDGSSGGDFGETMIFHIVCTM
jgi:hypothetical protein